MKLPPHAWSSLLGWLDEVLEVSPDDPIAQRAWLDRHHETLGEWRPHLERLLAQRQGLEQGQFLARLPTFETNRVAAPSQVGPYHLVREIGHGGMAQVWLAERADGQHRRPVALKLPFVSARSTVMGERFMRERDILSSLQHVHIASVLDAGTDDGQPWLALEFVDGQPITTFAESHHLDTRARVKLLLQVLEAVQYAHSKLVIHRDLKPSNVLVDEHGRVKLLDFGVAKLLDDDGAADETALTQEGGRALTPQYASPEQLAGEPLGTASDVYSLGLLAYELLTGELPYAMPRGSMPSMRTHVLNARIERPSVRVADAKRRRQLSGDLDTIVTQALRFDPRERYASVEAMANDLARHLDSQPILARPSTLAYRARKMFMRHRVTVTAGLLVLLTLASGLAVSLRQAHIARTQAKRADAAKHFLEDMLRGGDARIARDKPRGSITAKELLDLNVDRIEQAFADDPDTQFELLGLAGEIYGHLREDERSTALLAKQTSLARATYGDDHPLVLNARLTEVWGDIEAQQYTAALTTLDDIERRLRRAGLEHSLVAAHYWLARGEALRAAHDQTRERLASFERANALYEQLDPHHDYFVAGLANAGTVLLDLGRLDEARAHYQRALEVAPHVEHRDDSAIAMLWGNLALIQRNQGDRAAVTHSLEQALAFARSTTGPDDPVYWYQAAARAEWANLQGDRADADARFDELLAHVPAQWDSNTAHAEVWEKVGTSLAAQGRLVEAKGWLERAYPLFVERPYREFDLRRLRLELGNVYDELGEPDPRHLLEAARDEYIKRDGWHDAVTLDSRLSWARWLMHHGRDDDAQRELQTIIDTSTEPTIALAFAWEAQAQLALEWGDLARARQALEAAQHTFEPIRQRVFDVRLEAALATTQCELLAASGAFAAAHTQAERALEALNQSDVPSSARRLRAVACERKTAATN